jgi:cell division transport system permease protein
VDNQKGLAIKERWEHLPYIKHLDYISREQSLKEQIETMGLDPTEFLGANPFSISMELHLVADYACSDSLQWITKELRREIDVADIVYQKDMVETLNSNLQRITFVLLFVTALLCIISLSLINNTVRLSVYSRRFIIHNMKLVGARWSFIRRPFLLRSLWIGLMASVLAVIAIVGGVDWLRTHETDLAHFLVWHNVGITLIVVVSFGLAITFICTYVSVTHYLRMRESNLYK